MLFAASGETEEDIGRSSVNLIEGEARCGGDVLVLRPEIPAVSRYLGYAADSPASRNQKACMGRGFTVVHIYGSQLKRLLLPLPPLSEQTAIVRFLGHADRRILRYIRAKQKLIKLLEEQKQAIIHRAVTRGLDPNVRLKPSDVEWLGDVPEHWSRWRLKRLLRPNDARTSTGLEQLLSLRRDMGVVVFTEHFARPPQAATLVGYKLVSPGQIVVNRLQANNGLIFRSDLLGLTSPDYSVFDVAEPADAEYLARLLRSPSYRGHFRRIATGLGTGSAGFLRLYDDDLLETLVWLPPKCEQVQAVAHIDAQLAVLEEALAGANRALRLQEEYRTRLIADVVTGKLDVREAAARLPEGDDSSFEVEDAVNDEPAGEDALEEIAQEVEE